MQSSYNRIFKGDSINKQGQESICTEFEVRQEKIDTNGVQESNAIIDSYENIGQSIIESARAKKDSIISEAYKQASLINKEAYEKAYQKGNKDGMDAGYKKAYEDGYQKNIDIAKREGEAIKKNADDVLKSAIAEKEKYLKDNENNIKRIIIDSVESVLKHELKDSSNLNDVVLDFLRQMKTTKSFVIKAREKYCMEFRKKVDEWKQKAPFKGDIFIVQDDSVGEGSVIVEHDGGKMVFGVDIACEKIKEIFEDEI